MRIAVVTDSTTDMPAEELEKSNIIMIPLAVTVGGETLLDQVELSSEDFYDRMLAAEELPTTSQPSLGEFIEFYENLAKEGYEAVVSIHIAPPLSGTVSTATIAASQVSIPVAVIDSRSVSSGAGLVVETACRLRDAGASFEEVVAAAEQATLDTKFYLAPDVIDNLVKGGRITADQAEGITMASIKLIFDFDDEGKLNNFAKVKGTKGIIKRLTEVALEHQQEFGKLRIRFLHVRNLAGIKRLTDALDEAGVDYETSSIDNCGAAVATHTGIGVIGMAVCAAPNQA